jgi:subtilisin family serine protease
MRVAQTALSLACMAVAALAVPATAYVGPSGLTRIAVGYTSEGRSAVQAFEDSLGVKQLDSLSAIDADVVGVTQDRSAATIAALRAFPGVRYAQLDGRAYAAGTPNDAYWPQEWSPVKTHAPQAWDLTTGSSSVVVAVVDTGVDAGQPDLAGRVLPGYDFVNGDADAGDDQGHGTAVAGVTAAAGDNGVGVAGYCWQCRILPVKVLGADGSGFNSWVAEGIIWAVDHGARVINASLGSLTDDLTLAAASQYAAQHGVLLVAAAGNDASAMLRYPAALPGVLSVGASDQNDQPYSFSNSGAAVAAPGENVTTGIQGSYVVFVGTSSAAPVVSGIAALAFAVAPTATAVQVTQALETTASPSPGSANGRVDAYATVHLLAPQLAPVAMPPSAPPSRPTASSEDGSVRMVLRGRLTSTRPVRAYAVRTGGGDFHAILSSLNRAKLRLKLRLLAPDASSLAGSAGSGPLRITLRVDPARYRLTVSRPRAGRPVAYRLVLVFPAP